MLSPQPQHVGTKKWIEPSHAAAYLRAVAGLKAEYVELSLDGDAVTGEAVIRRIQRAIAAHGGPVMMDNGISAYVACAASENAVVVLDPHVCGAIADGDAGGALAAGSARLWFADGFDAARTRRWMLAFAM